MCCAFGGSNQRRKLDGTSRDEIRDEFGFERCVDTSANLYALRFSRREDLIEIPKEQVEVTMTGQRSTVQ